jgi:hypothetical protein
MLIELMTIYYTYAWLRKDGTPYYIGKGKGKRAYKHRKGRKPPPRERILLLKTGLTENEAFKHEIYMIAVFGRKDKNSGCLINNTDGGEGVSGNSGPLNPMFGKLRPDLSARNRESRGVCRGDEFKETMSMVTRGDKNPMYGKKRPDLSERNKLGRGKKLSPETVDKMRQAHSNRVWITNGEEESLVKSDLEIPFGWRRGRKTNND